jgi:hypothetical protein
MFLSDMVDNFDLPVQSGLRLFSTELAAMIVRTLPL